MTAHSEAERLARGILKDSHNQGFGYVPQVIGRVPPRLYTIDEIALSQMLLDALSEVELLKGAIRAQDERERDAGEKCGVEWLTVGCDWPDWVADCVLTLRAEVAALKALVKQHEHMERSVQTIYSRAKGEAWTGHVVDAACLLEHQVAALKAKAVPKDVIDCAVTVCLAVVEHPSLLSMIGEDAAQFVLDWHAARPREKEEKHEG